MPRTPDRYPGVREEDEVRFDEVQADPPDAGSVRYVNGYLRARDSEGVFGLRGGGGITEEQHRQLDQLVHNLAEDYYEEYTRTGNKVTNITVWTDSGKTQKIREEQYTYSGNLVTEVVTIQYDGSGAEFERLTETYTYTANKVTSVTAVRSAA